MLHNLLAYAVEQEALPDNPLPRVRWSPPKVAEQVDPRVVVNPVQARELLTAVTYVGTPDADRGARLVAFFAALYFAALRPAEALGLREQDCELPVSGWGSLTLAQSRPVAGKRYTDAGETLWLNAGVPATEVAERSASTASVRRSTGRSTVYSADGLARVPRLFRECRQRPG